MRATLTGALTRSLLAGAVAATALLVSACASGEPSGGSSAPESSGSASPSPTPTPSPSPSESESVPADDAVSPAAGKAVRGLPEGAEGTMDSPAGAGWSPTPGLLYVVTYGSGSCPRVAEAQAEWDDAHETVVVTVAEPKPGPCTMDYMPTTSAAQLPEGADSGAPLTVQLGDLGTVEVPPRDGAGATGPVAWVAPAAG